MASAKFQSMPEFADNEPGRSNSPALEMQPTQKLQPPQDPHHPDEQASDPVPTGSTYHTHPQKEEKIDFGSQSIHLNPISQDSSALAGSSSDRIEPSGPVKSNDVSASNLSASSEIVVSVNESTNVQTPSPPPLTRQKTVPAIGPATDKPSPLPSEMETEGPVLFITLLLASTGARHPYKLDEKYLKKRNVGADGNNPINISLYKLKELILRDWRDEWEAKPSSPESIRLISMGKLLNDKQKLSDAGFTNGVTPHIVHMSVKPQDIIDEEEARLKAGGKDREGNERSLGCRCVIM